MAEILTKQDLIDYIRNNVNIQNKEEGVEDKDFLSMTDEQIELYVKVALTRDFPKVSSIEVIPNDIVYPLVLIAKKELFHALAILSAPLFNITADNNNQLQRASRFEHYMSLIKQVDEEYNAFVEDGGAGRNTLTSYDVLLGNRYATKRNYEKGVIPVLYLSLGNVTSESIDIRWEVQLSRFLNYKVYISNEPIYDDLRENVISDKAKLVSKITDIHKTGCRITGLTPGTTYYICVEATERSQLSGYSEVIATTLEVIEPSEDLEEVSIDEGGAE